MKFITKLRHWKLFILFFLGTGIASIGTITVLNSLFNFSIRIADSMIPIVIAYFLWGSWMIKSIILLDRHYKSLTEKQQLTLKYGTMFLILYAFKLINYDLRITLIEFPTGLSLFISFVMHIGGFFLFYYFIYLFAKGLAISKHGENLRAGDLILQVLRILFFPIGVWTVQPELNKLCLSK